MEMVRGSGAKQYARVGSHTVLGSGKNAEWLKLNRTLGNARQSMAWGEIIGLALDSFRASKTRFALTALGMVIGSASLILVVTIGLTGKQYIINQLQSVGTNLVELTYSGGGVGSVNEGRADFLTRDDERAVVEQVPAVAASSAMLEMHSRISLGGGDIKDVLVLGVSPQYEQVRNLVVLHGRFFDDEDERTHAKAAVVTVPFARQMFGGGERAIDQTFELSGIPFTVIGVFKESVNSFGRTEIADRTILIPYSVGRYLSGTDDVNTIFFSIRDGSDVPDASRQIEQIVHARHRRNSVYTAFNLTAMLQVAGQVTSALTAVLFLVSTVTLAVGGVGIMNIMLANVSARIHEIGVRKALGATARQIKLQFLMEAALISLSGGLVGSALGLALPLSVRYFTDFKVPLSGWSVVIALITSTLIGIVFGTLPANRAAKMDPVESLKFE